MRLGLGLCGLVLVGALAGQAHAYPFETPPPSSEPRSPGKALAWSASLTALGSAVLVGGLAADQEAAGVFLGTPILIFGPAIGRGYGRGPVFPGLLIRGVSGAVVVFALKDNLLKCTDECGDEDPLYLEGDEKIVVYGAATIIIASAVYDTVRAPLDAREYNREHGFAVAPTVMKGEGGRALAPGLVVGGRF